VMPDQETLLANHRIPQVKQEKTKGLELALACARAADDIQAEDIRILDLRGLSSLTDFMVVCSGSSMPHLKAISREVSKGVSDRVGQSPFQTEGKAVTRWVVLDYFDVMVHVLHEEMREHYALEGLWGDAKEVSWAEEATSAAEAPQ
jgi:ribosome-associated protein